MTKEPFITHSEITNEIYIVCGAEKYLVTEQVVKAMRSTGRLEQPTIEEILSHITTGITATGQSDSYCVGFCNALIWLKSCITHEEPQFFKDKRGRENE